LEHVPVSPLDALRARVVRAVTDRFVGDEAIKVVAGHSDEPWLPPDSPARQVHGDIAMLIGGIRALLLQSLHPVAMQAVHDHSGYRSDPWGRLQRTAAFIAATTFGSVDQARERIEQVRRIHDRVTGTMPDHTSYAASDPDLLLWTHVAEADSFLRANRAYAVNPLPDAEVDRYLADLAITARALGVLDPPLSAEQLQEQLEAYRPVLRGTEPARAAAALALRNPPLTGPARAGYQVLAFGALAILPAWARGELGVPTLPIIDRTVLRPSARALLVTLDRAFEAEARRRPSERSDAAA
jgi:uncharacterized protein (DUF2236 family)